MAATTSPGRQPHQATPTGWRGHACEPAARDVDGVPDSTTTAPDLERGRGPVWGDGTECCDNSPSRQSQSGRLDRVAWRCLLASADCAAMASRLHRQLPRDRTRVRRTGRRRRLNVCETAPVAIQQTDSTSTGGRCPATATATATASPIHRQLPRDLERRTQDRT